MLKCNIIQTWANSRIRPSHTKGVIEANLGVCGMSNHKIGGIRESKNAPGRVIENWLIIYE